MFVVLTLVVGVLTPLCIPFVYPPAYYAVLTPTPDPGVLAVLYWGIIGLVTVIGLWQFAKPNPAKADRTEDGIAAAIYAGRFFMLYLAVFAALWLYAMPEYFAAEAGLTARGTPIGAIGFVAVCFAACGYIPFRGHAAKQRS